MHFVRVSQFALSFALVAAATLLVPGQFPAALHAGSSIAAPSAGSLVQAGDLGYIGSFRVPTQANLNYDHSGHGLTFDPQRNSLFVANFNEEVSEISIPTPGTGSSVSSLPRANLIQGPVKVLGGLASLAGDQIGGLLVDGNSLIVSVYRLYDANGTADKSHFRVPRTLAQASAVGPIEVGNRKAGYVAGPMARVPHAWQSLIGGPALTGLCCVSIISRSSYGPSATVFDPTQVTGSVANVPGTMLLGYPNAHPTLGDWNSSYTLFNNATEMAGMVWVEGTDSLLYFGRKGDRYCYGDGAVCGDPTSASKGDHAYPYEFFVWAYNVNDLVAVKQGVRQPWEVTPYASWTFSMPFATGARILRGVAYDPATQRIFLAEQRADGSNVLIRVLQLGVPSVPMPVNAQPVVQASCTVCTAETGQPVSVTAQAADPDGDPLTYDWQGAGGTFANARSATTTFSSTTAGTATLTVTVRDGRGGQGLAAVNVTFTAPAGSTPTPTPPPGGETPTQPAPTEPKPTEPAPTEPTPTEPAPTEPAPTEPKPTEPAPAPAPPETTTPEPGDTLLSLLPACSDPDPWTLLGGGVCFRGRWFPPSAKYPRRKDASDAGTCTTPDPFALFGGGVCRNGEWYPNRDLATRGRSAFGGRP